MDHHLKMTEWLILERLEGNDLPLPKYETINSAGVDFPACLTRPQRLVPEAAKFSETRPFYPLTGKLISLPDRWALELRHFYEEGIIESYYPPDRPGDKQWWASAAPTPMGAYAKELIIYPRETVMVSLGYKCEFSKAYVLMLHIRSSIGMMGLELANSTGIIDPDYRGELWAVLHNRNTSKPITIRHGDRLVQGVMFGFNQSIIEEGAVQDTVRGEGGFGSTGVATKNWVVSSSTDVSNPNIGLNK